jgi:hypothetical protein
MVEMIEGGEVVKAISLTDFYENHEKHKKMQKDFEFAKFISKNKESLLHMINNETIETVIFKEDAKQKLDYILNSTDDNTISYSCIGNNSGSDLSCHAWSIAKNITSNEKELNILVSQVLFRNMTENLPEIPEIALTMTYIRGDTKLQIVIKQQMKQMECKKNSIGRDVYEVDTNEKCYIELV